MLSSTSLTHFFFVFPLWSTRGSCLISNNFSQLQVFTSGNVFTYFPTEHVFLTAVAVNSIDILSG